MPYNPPRTQPKPTGDPLEIDLVFNVTRCGACSFFWPEDATRQPYGPYPTFDFPSNTPKVGTPKNGYQSSPWLKAKTQVPAFPNPEIMDGCRKAPIMTIGINPNLTAFAPGRMGAAWAYPNFSSSKGTNLYAKTAYYYRYRSIFQERFNLKYISQYLSKKGQVVAPKAGTIVDAKRPNDSPNYVITVHYDGDAANTTIRIQEKPGEPRFVLLLDALPPDNRFNKGDIVAARLDVPPDRSVEVFQQQIGYYEQFIPTLQQFESFLTMRGHHGVDLRIGEDVGQLDMVACASPHWGPPFLGGTKETETTIVNNCVQRNAWAIKQLVQTQPVVLFLVGEASYNMFRHSFGRMVQPSLPRDPTDGAFTLLRETSDSKQPYNIVFSTTVGGRRYDLSTRLVVTPHFSYSAKFLPQFRMSDHDWQHFANKFPGCVGFLGGDKRIEHVPSQPGSYAAYQIKEDPVGILEQLRQSYATSAWPELRASYYNAHQMMAGVLADLYDQGLLTYTDPTSSASGYLTRTSGSCHFCDNRHWNFPLGCPYGKTKEQAPPQGFLGKVAEAVVTAGRVR